MFIQLPINKFILEDNKLFINESVIEYENISEESREVLESLISKGAYFSSLLELNSNYNVKTINEKEITLEDYTKYLQECKELKKECIVETTALNFKPLTNIKGLEIMENDNSIARGKNNKLFIEDFRITEEDHASVWLSYQNKAEQLFEDAKRDLTEYDGMFEDFCDAVGNMAKNYTLGYNEDDEEIYEECEGTQVDDIAGKEDYEVGSLQKPKKVKHTVDEMFNVPNNHGFKKFMMDEQGHYVRGNYVLINENGSIKAVNKKIIEAEIMYSGIIITNKEAESRTKEFCDALNKKMNKYSEDDPLYDFKYRIEDDTIKFADYNELFDYESKEYKNGELNKLIQQYFGPDSYAEPENSVIFTIAGVEVRERQF